MSIKRDLCAVGCMLLLAMAVAAGGCTHEVKVVGDKDKPIPINAEIKIHIYQHAASVVDEMYGEEYEEPEEIPTSFIDRALRVVVDALGVRSAYAADMGSQWQDAKRAMVEAQRTAAPHLKRGLLGENRNGYVAPIDKAANAGSDEVKAAARAADDLNAKRKAFYTLDAEQQGVSIRHIQSAYAKAIRDKAKGIWVEVERDGAWAWERR
jgi:uncharacterized protein YdbL (DUF1318 family)